jgi:hypothetical protein
MPNTPLQTLPYPALSDPANGPVGFQNLAQAVEKKLVQVYVDATDRAAKVTAPTAGMLCYLTTAARYELYNGTAWVPLGAGQQAVCGGLKQTAAQSGWTSTLHAKVTMQSATHNVRNMADVANSQLIAREAGIYFVWGMTVFEGNGAGYRRATIRINATDQSHNARSFDPATTVGLPTITTVAYQGQLAVNDTIQLWAMQVNASATLSTFATATYFSCLFAHLIQAT